MITSVLPPAVAHAARNFPSTVQQAEEIIAKWPHLAKTSTGGRLTDRLSDLIERTAREGE